MKTEARHSKFITLSFVLFGLVAFITTRVLFETFAASFGVVGRLWTLSLLRHGLPVGIGLFTFGFLQLQSRYVVWADEVLSELFKVVWPSRKDTTAMTIVACIMIIVAGVILGVFDLISSKFMEVFLTL